MCSETKNIILYWGSFLGVLVLKEERREEMKVEKT